MKISQKIIDYAIWYYLKYYPSPKKLVQKLKQKFGPDSEKGQKYWWISDLEIDFILKEKLKNIIQEKEVIISKINSYKNKGKSKRYIVSKMYERQENIDLVNEVLQDYFSKDDELENLKKELIKQKYDKNLDYEQKQKILARIMRKWYNYNDIKKIIN